MLTLDFTLMAAMQKLVFKELCINRLLVTLMTDGGESCCEIYQIEGHYQHTLCECGLRECGLGRRPPPPSRSEGQAYGLL